MAWIATLPVTISRLALVSSILLGCAACKRGQASRATTEAKRGSAASAPAQRMTDADGRRILTFEGSCDASGAIEFDRTHVLVADDENNVLRLYDVERGGPPEKVFDLSPSLGLDPDDAEADLEASTRVGDRAYFLTSHGRTSKGKRDHDRLMFFSVSLTADADQLALVGQPYRSLLDDLIRDPKFARFELAAAAERAPKEPGGLNLEGLTALENGTMLIGFRSPIPRGRALLASILNPEELLQGKSARFSEPISLDLGGLGVRALSSWRSNVLILAGPSGTGGPFKMFSFDGRDRVTPLDVDISDLNAEALFAHEERDDVLVLSDDGTREINGRKCKKLKDDTLKRFTAHWVTPPK